MKIIFLDIDGVLNVCYPERDDYGSLFHPHLQENFKRLIDETGAKIVISSSWRKNGLVEMQNMWRDRKLPGEVIDTTVSLYLKRGGCIQFWNDKLTQEPTPQINGYSIPRGCEIEYWLKEKGYQTINWDDELQKKDITDSGIESYVIIDDDSDMLFSQRNNFVKTSGNMHHEDCVDWGYGLTKKCVDLAIKILNKQL